MLTSSFIQVPGIGQKTETHIWTRGILSWKAFSASGKESNLPDSKVDKIRRCLDICSKHLDESDARFFTDLMPRSELWRLYPEFRHKTAFVDIETTGLSPYYDKITLIGLYDGKDYRAYIAGHNLEEFADDIRRYGLIVTFNGSLFDLPFLRKAFPSLALPGHVDLRFFLRRLGFSGSLKAIEKRTGIARPQEVDGFDGFDATILWNRYVHGNTDALRLLVEYNRSDVVNLRVLMEVGCRMMRHRLLPDQQSDKGPGASATGRTPRATARVRKISNSTIELTAEKIKYVITVPKHRRKTIQPMIAKLGGVQRAPRVVGIDLTGSEQRASGWALLQGTHARTKLIKTDEELIAETVKAAPRIISIDSPLSIPGGGSGEEAEAIAIARFGIMRACERTLRRRGIHVYPCLLPSMKGLTRRGMRLTEEFKKLGFEVIESYPGAAQDILGIIRKRVDIRELMQGLLDFGIDGDFNNGTINHDKLDAVTSALVGYFYLTDSYEALGNEKEGYLIVPQARR